MSKKKKNKTTRTNNEFGIGKEQLKEMACKVPQAFVALRRFDWESKELDEASRLAKRKELEAKMSVWERIEAVCPEEFLESLYFQYDQFVWGFDFANGRLTEKFDEHFIQEALFRVESNIKNVVDEAFSPNEKAEQSQEYAQPVNPQTEEANMRWALDIASKNSRGIIEEALWEIMCGFGAMKTASKLLTLFFRMGYKPPRIGGLDGSSEKIRAICNLTAEVEKELKNSALSMFLDDDEV